MTVLATGAALLAATSTTAGADEQHAPEAPVELTVNDRERPLEVEGAPAFGWLPRDADRGEVQTAYHIRVFDADDEDERVWDSGKVASSEQAYVRYEGPELASGSDYTWTVRTWDVDDQVSPWAGLATFETGIGIDEWDGAAWIRRETDDGDEYTMARTEVMVRDSPVVRARAYTSAYHQYRLYLNGDEVDDGPAFSYPGEGYYQAADVTEHVEPGEPLAIGLLYHWYGRGQGRPTAAAERGGVHKLVIEYADGSRQVVVTDGSWRVRQASQWETGVPRRNSDAGEWVEWIDARKAPTGWNEPGHDDSGGEWTDATVVGTLPFGELTELTGQETRLAGTAAHPVSLTTLDDGAVVADFGAVIPARPVIHFSDGTAGRQIDIQTSYALTDDGHASTGRTDTQGSNMSMRYIQRDGEQTMEAFLHWGWRYLEIRPPGPGEELAVDDITAVIEHAEVPEDRAASFESSDPTLDAVWEMMRRSAIYSVQHQFVDTPTREKGQFLGDAVDISYATMMAHGERTATRKGIREFLHSADRYWNDGDLRGRYNAVYPNGDGRRDIPDYSLMMVDWVGRYHLETGDAGLVAEAYPYLAQTAEYVLREIEQTGPAAGLVTDLDGGSGDYEFGIVDWPRHGRFGYDMDTTARTTVNAQSVHALRTVAELGETIGRPDTEVASYRRVADELADRMNATLRRGDGVYVDGLRADGTPSSHAGQHSTSYAIAYGVAPEEDYPELAEHLAGMGMRQGPMTAHWLLQALADADRADAVLELLTNEDDWGWANILAQGGTFTWESWDPSGSESYSHGWGAQAAVDVLSTLLGVRVTGPGASTVDVVVPQDVLDHARGTVPTQRGPVSVAWDRRDGELGLDVTIPVNTSAEVWVPAVDRGAVTEGGVPADDADGVEFRRMEDGYAVFAVGSGDYRFLSDDVLGHLHRAAHGAAALYDQVRELVRAGELTADQRSYLDDQSEKLTAAVTGALERYQAGDEDGAVRQTQRALSVTDRMTRWITKQQRTGALTDDAAAALVDAVEAARAPLTSASARLLGVTASLVAGLRTVAAGDRVDVVTTVQNTGSRRVQGVAVEIEPPPDWAVRSLGPDRTGSLAPGETFTARFAVAVPATEPVADDVVLPGTVTFRHGGGTAEIPVSTSVEVISPVTIEALHADPPIIDPGGTSNVTATVVNTSAANVSGALRASVPEGWGVEPAEIAYELTAGASTEASFRLTAPSEDGAAAVDVTALYAGNIGDTASVEITVSDDDVVVVQPQKLADIRRAAEGSEFYVDRTATITDLPEALAGTLLIPGANDDKQVQEPADYLVFDLKRDATVYVAVDERGEGSWWPSWLLDGGFERTGMTIGTTDSPLVVFGKDVPAGRVTLGPNAATTGSSSTYITLVVPR